MHQDESGRRTAAGKRATAQFEVLRARAEELVPERRETESEAPDILELIHELRIHQAELEIQNEELQRSQGELSELQREYENLYEFAPCGYVTLDAKGRITRVNLTGVKLLGKTRSWVLQTNFSRFIAPGWEDALGIALRNAGRTGEKQSIDIPIKREFDLSLWVHAEIEADRNEDAAVIQWRIALVDITAKKRAEEALLESEARFRNLYENAPIAYQSLDEEGNFVMVNETWLATLGYTDAEVIGRHFTEFLHPEWRDRFDLNFHCFKAAGETTASERMMRKKDGTDILVSFHGKMGKDASGKFPRTHCVFHDITARREAEAERQRLEEQLQQARRMESIGVLAGGVAHEFNNILSIILGNSELAMNDMPVWQHARENLNEIRLASLRARDVVKQLLTFSRRQPSNKIALFLGSVVADSIRLIRASIPANIDIRCTVADDLAPVEGDATQINQLMINLCANAKDAMLTTGGEITVDLYNETLETEVVAVHRAVNPGRYVKLVVRDTGCGMDEETLERIFEPYFTTKGFGRGTGIGLAVVHGIVEKHNAAITVDSLPNRGTVFTIRFPVCEECVEPTPEKRKCPNTGNERILLVDDESPILKLGQSRLKGLGYTVRTFEDPVAALENFKADPNGFDLVITDMSMPNMTGDRLAREMLAIRPDMPIILCTGYSEQISDENAREFGIRAFAMKPLDAKTFAETVRAVLDSG